MIFSTTTDLLPHQPPAVAKLLPARVGGLFMDMGTGKSRVLLELARLRGHKWDRLYWFTPCSLKETIRQQIAIHTDIPPDQVAVWDDHVHSDRRPAQPVQIIGIETMSSSDRAVTAFAGMVTDQSFVAVDESAYIKGPMARRTQRITAMSERARYRAVLNGTPLTQGAVDLYSQMRFLSPKILGYRSFWSFAANHLTYEVRRDGFGRRVRTGRIIRSHNVEWLAARIAPYVYQVRKDECLDLPEKLYADRFCTMTGQQRDLYERAKVELLLDLERHDWERLQILRLFSVLQTITCGYWRRLREDGTRELITVPHNRLSLLAGVLDEIPRDDKVIIWSRYHHSTDEIVRMLAERDGEGSAVRYDGSLGDRARQQHLARWRQPGGPRHLVATMGVGGRGLTLNEAAYSVFYADSFRYEDRIQSEDRNHRIGQTRRPVYVTLRCGNSIDDRIAASRVRKASTLAEFQHMVDRYRSQGLRDRLHEMVMTL